MKKNLQKLKKTTDGWSVNLECLYYVSYECVCVKLLNYYLL